MANLNIPQQSKELKTLGDAIVRAFLCLQIHADGKVFTCHLYNKNTGTERGRKKTQLRSPKHSVSQNGLM
jgi:hypothetical protein